MTNNKIFNTIKFIGGANDFMSLPQNNLPEVAFWGRSNVGKSSTINSIFNNNSVARVSSNPGRTQQINLFVIGNEQAVVVDLPGYGYAKVSKKIAATLYNLCYNYIHKSRPKIVFLLIDSRRGLMNTDSEVIEALNVIGHRMCIILTKVDLVSQDMLMQLQQDLGGLDYLMISNKSKTGITQLKDKIIDIINERENRRK
jgi:GTP-binding protein